MAQGSAYALLLLLTASPAHAFFGSRPQMDAGARERALMPELLLTEDQKDQLWAELQAQLKKSPRLVYHNGSKKIPHRGYFVPNQTDFLKYVLPESEEGELRLGFSSTIGHIIDVERKIKRFISVDISSEVVIAHMSFYRPLWLASETPQEWLSQIAAIPLLPNEPIESVIHRVLLKNPEPRDPKVVEALEKKLEKLVQQGLISDADRRFTMAVIGDQVNPPASEWMLTSQKAFKFELSPETRGIFRRSLETTNIAKFLAGVFFPEDAQRAYVSGPEQYREFSEAVFRKRSFLTDLHHFRRIRALYENGQDYYAVADARDPKLWSAVGDFARQSQMNLTDVYLSKVPQLIRGKTPWFDDWLAGKLERIPGPNKLVYEVDVVSPYLMTVGVPDPVMHGTRGLLQQARSAGVTFLNSLTCRRAMIQEAEKADSQVKCDAWCLT